MPSEVRRLRQTEEENAKLERPVAVLRLDKAMLLGVPRCVCGRSGFISLLRPSSTLSERFSFGGRHSNAGRARRRPFRRRALAQYSSLPRARYIIR